MCQPFQHSVEFQAHGIAEKTGYDYHYSLYAPVVCHSDATHSSEFRHPTPIQRGRVLHEGLVEPKTGRFLSKR